MDSSNYAVAGRGLRTMFIGEIVMLISGFLILIPFVGIIGMIAGFVLEIMGLNTAGPVRESYRTALYVTIANAVVSLLGALTGGEGLLSGLLSAAGTLLSLYVVYVVCTVSSQLLGEKGDVVQAKRGNDIWKVYAACTVIGIVCQVLAVIPLVNLLAAVVSVVAAIVLFVAGILYLIFLYNASASLQSA